MKIRNALLLTAAITVSIPGMIFADETETEKNPPAEYSENDLYLLSHLIAGEANDCSTLMKQYVGSVVLNRVEDSRFPDTLEEVINQPGQYSCTWDGNFGKEPNEDTLSVAKELLEYGSVLDPCVIFQAEFVQGQGVYDQIYDPTMNTTMYFCY